MHGPTSAPSSPATVWKEQCKGRQRREKQWNTEGMQSAEWSTAHHSDFSLDLWHKEPSLPWQCNVEQQKE